LNNELCRNVVGLVERLENNPAAPCEDFSTIAHCTAAYILDYFGEAVPGLLAPSLTEPKGGSDLRHLSTRIDLRDSGAAVVRGEKIFTTNATKADWLVVLVASDKGHAISLVSAKAAGVSIEPMDIIGYDCSGIGRVIYDNAEGRLIGQPGREAYKAALQAIALSRLLVAAHAIGLARRVLSYSIKTLIKRGSWAYQAPRHRVARAYAYLETAYSYVEKTAARIANNPMSFDWSLTSIAKYVTVEAAKQAIDAAIMSTGGVALLRDNGLMDALSRVYALVYAEGTQDIQLEIIAKSLEKPYGPAT
jgi:alkylation response protein AidB-like acyl-CoA dehydrogenase